jgi:hypothetical protein
MASSSMVNGDLASSSSGAWVRWRRVWGEVTRGGVDDGLARAVARNTGFWSKRCKSVMFRGITRDVYQVAHKCVVETIEGKTEVFGTAHPQVCYRIVLPSSVIMQPSVKRVSGKPNISKYATEECCS